MGYMRRGGEVSQWAVAQADRARECVDDTARSFTALASAQLSIRLMPYASASVVLLDLIIDASIGSALSADYNSSTLDEFCTVSNTNTKPSQPQPHHHHHNGQQQQQQQQHGDDDDDDEEDGRGDGVLALLSAPRVRDDVGGVAVLGVRETAHQHLQVQGLWAPGVLALCEEGDGEEEGLRQQQQHQQQQQQPQRQQRQQQQQQQQQASPRRRRALGLVHSRWLAP
ncbi:hypothetical protein LTR27_003457 [Elasticomyces elasticus]|nr:hypothetical protein LTR27_003457 [Elasticomyces elasticus]